MTRIACFVTVLCLLCAQGGAVAAPPDRPQIHEAPALGEAVERQLSPDERYTPWRQDESGLPPARRERVEIQQVVEKSVRTVKLPNVVPPILFGSGEASIPPDYVERVRVVLERMQDRRNVVGHTDNVPLIGEAQVRYGDNTGLARERAGVAAEFFQRALNLPPESVTYEGMGERQPVASNATPAGRAQNRRMEVEVWYDEIDEKQVEKEVVLADEVRRIPVCRVEQMCRISYKAGHARRTRVKNLIPPFHYDDDSTTVPADYQRKLLQVLGDLGSKEGVVVKFIGYTDTTPLSGRDARIYGDHLGISKARARRFAQALQEALKLPAGAVDSDGRGAASPLAPNDTESGRAANRRIEVEFWHDDPLQVLWAPDDLARHLFVGGFDELALIRDRLSQGQALLGYETRLRRRDGSTIDVLMNLLLKPESEGVFEG
ncbi:MAG: OmpA family protein, partial [Curvibacter sp.]